MHRIDTRKLYIGLALVVIGFIAIQIWSFSRTFTNPPVVETPLWDSEQTYLLVQRACYDCHSHETEWPWYSKLWPLSITIESDVIEGRKVFNFSEWKGVYTQEEIEAMAETVGQEQMPLPLYIVLHPEAKLTEQERGQLTNGLIATMRGEGEIRIEEK